MGTKNEKISLKLGKNEASGGYGLWQSFELDKKSGKSYLPAGWYDLGRSFWGYTYLHRNLSGTDKKTGLPLGFLPSNEDSYLLDAVLVKRLILNKKHLGELKIWGRKGR